MGDRLVRAIEDLDEKATLAEAKALLKKGAEWKRVLDFLREGMKLVGKKYESGEYFIADLILSGMIFKNVVDLPEMRPRSVENKSVRGTAIVGTVEGDIHDVGKNILISLLMARGMNVVDLGTDVAPAQFVDEIRVIRPAIVALSGIMSFSALSMKKTIDALREAGLRDSVKVMVGGGCVTEEIAREIGADGYSSDCLEGLDLCTRWLGQAIT